MARDQLFMSNKHHLRYEIKDQLDATVCSMQAEAQLQPAKRAPLKTSRTKSPKHNELRTRRPMW